MPYYKNRTKTHIDVTTGEVTEVQIVETAQQRRARLTNEARQQTVKERRDQKREEEREASGKKKIKHDYMPEAYPWDSIRQYFVEGAPDANGAMHYPTITELCKVYGVNFFTIRKRLLDENWVQQRDQFQVALHKQIQKAALLDYVEAASKFDATCVEAAQRAMQEILDRFHEAEAQGEPIDQLGLDRMGRAAVNWQRVGRLALGLSTENTSRHETKSTESINSIEFGLLTDEELQQVKQLLLRAETRQEGDIIEGVLVQEQPLKTSEIKDNDQSQKLREHTDEVVSSVDSEHQIL